MINSELPRHYWRNFWCLALDYCFFGIGMAFISTNTVIPGFLTILGASSVFIGLVSSLQSASWLLPQLFAARYLSGKPRKKPYILWPAAIGRSFMLIPVLVIWGTGAQPAWLTMLVTALVVIGFWTGDGLASVPWFDLLSSSIPPHRRGRLTGTGQVLSGMLGFLAGWLVEWILSASGPSFPNNYASLFMLGFVMLVISFIAITFIAEEKSVSADSMPGWREYGAQLWLVLKRDRAFRRFIFARQLSGLSSLATPFYMPYALEELGLPAQVAGRYTSIGVVGGILAAIVFGWLNERYGSKRVILSSLGISIVIPVTALLMPVLIPNPTWLAWGYGLVFFCLKAQMSSMMAGWMTYILEWSPETERPLYIGLTNTLNGITPLFATLGGLILQWTGGNYRLLFAITVVGLVLACPLPMSLPEPRDKDAGRVAAIRSDASS